MVSAGISEVILVLPLVVATRPWASVLTSLGYSLLIYQTGENTHAWGCGNHVRKCMESASSLRCHDATFTEHKARAGKAGLLWECRQGGRGGRRGPHGHVHSACLSESKGPDTQRRPDTEPRPVRASAVPAAPPGTICRLYAKHRMLPPFPMKINPSNGFPRSSCFIFHPAPRGIGATGWTESLAVQTLLL